MNDEQFEEAIQLTLRGYSTAADQLRARDTAQREALAHAISGRSDAQEELVRVEAERDRFAKRLCVCRACGGRGELHTGQYTNEGHWQPPEPVMVECGDCNGAGQIGEVTDLEAAMSFASKAQSQLAEAVGLLRDSREGLRTGPIDGWEHRLATRLSDFLAHHTQAEQQEAGPRLVSYSEEMATCTLNYKGREYYFTLDGRSDEEAQGALAGDDEHPECFCVEHELHIEKLQQQLAEARAALATQPAAHRNSEFFIDFDTLRKALSIYGLAAPVSNEELGLQMERQAVRVIEAVAKLPFPASVAAHGDEAVRKPELVGYFSFCEDKQKWLQQRPKGAEFNHLFTPLYTMRAQGDGGEV